jgi:hypothetical protein
MAEAKKCGVKTPNKKPEELVGPERIKELIDLAVKKSGGRVDVDRLTEDLLSVYQLIKFPEGGIDAVKTPEAAKMLNYIQRRQKGIVEAHIKASMPFNNIILDALPYKLRSFYHQLISGAETPEELFTINANVTIQKINTAIRTLTNKMYRDLYIKRGKTEVSIFDEVEGKDQKLLYTNGIFSGLFGRSREDNVKEIENSDQVVRKLYYFGKKLKDFFYNEMDLTMLETKEDFELAVLSSFFSKRTMFKSLSEGTNIKPTFKSKLLNLTRGIDRVVFTKDELNKLKDAFVKKHYNDIEVGTTTYINKKKLLEDLFYMLTDNFDKVHIKEELGVKQFSTLAPYNKFKVIHQNLNGEISVKQLKGIVDSYRFDVKDYIYENIKRMARHKVLSSEFTSNPREAFSKLRKVLNTTLGTHENKNKIENRIRYYEDLIETLMPTRNSGFVNIGVELLTNFSSIVKSFSLVGSALRNVVEPINVSSKSNMLLGRQTKSPKETAKFLSSYTRETYGALIRSMGKKTNEIKMLEFMHDFVNKIVEKMDISEIRKLPINEQLKLLESVGAHIDDYVVYNGVVYNKEIKNVKEGKVTNLVDKLYEMSGLTTLDFIHTYLSSLHAKDILKDMMINPDKYKDNEAIKTLFDSAGLTFEELDILKTMISELPSDSVVGLLDTHGFDYLEIFERIETIKNMDILKKNEKTAKALEVLKKLSKLHLNENYIDAPFELKDKFINGLVTDELRKILKVNQKNGKIEKNEEIKKILSYILDSEMSKKYYPDFVKGKDPFEHIELYYDFTNERITVKISDDIGLSATAKERFNNFLGLELTKSLTSYKNNYYQMLLNVLDGKNIETDEGNAAEVVEAFKKFYKEEATYTNADGDVMYKTEYIKDSYINLLNKFTVLENTLIGYLGSPRNFNDVKIAINKLNEHGEVMSVTTQMVKTKLDFVSAITAAATQGFTALNFLSKHTNKGNYFANTDNIKLAATLAPNLFLIAFYQSLINSVTQYSLGEDEAFTKEMMGRELYRRTMLMTAISGYSSKYSFGTMRALAALMDAEYSYMFKLMQKNPMFYNRVLKETYNYVIEDK